MNTRFIRVQTFRHRSFVMMLSTLLVILMATSGSTSANEVDEQAVGNACTVYVVDYGFANDPACAEAITEASGWPDLDPSSLGDQARLIEQARAEAAAEASGWPDLDPSSLGDRVRLVEAAGEEAAAWPDFDSSNIQDV